MPSFSHLAKDSAPMGAPAPAMPPITAGMLDTTDAIIGEPVSKPISDGIFELRARHGTLRARLLYYFSPSERRLIVFVHGVVKKTSKIGKAEIRLAKKRRNEIEQGEPTYDINAIDTVH